MSIYNIRDYCENDPPDTKYDFGSCCIKTLTIDDVHDAIAVNDIELVTMLLPFVRKQSRAEIVKIFTSAMSSGDVNIIRLLLMVSSIPLESMSYAIEQSLMYSDPWYMSTESLSAKCALAVMFIDSQ